MARSFNGTTNHAESTFDLSGESIITVAFWFYMDAYYNDTSHSLLEYSNTSWTNGGFLFIPWANLGPVGFQGFLLGVATAGGTSVWLDSSANVTPGAWHSAVIVYDRTGPTFILYVNGSLKSLATVLHQPGTYGNFANSSLNFFSRNAGGSQIATGRIAEFAVWSGNVLGANTGSGGSASRSLPQAIGSGVPPPLAISQQPLVYIPWLGYDSPEPDYAGGRHSAVLTGPLQIRHPGVRSILMPGSAAS